MAEYIERETLFEEIRKEFRPYWQIPCDYEDRITQKMVTKMRGLIDKLPAADVIEVVHSKWIRDSLTGHISCLNCKMTAPGDCELEDFYESDFCPMCGAKMDGKENGK
ncbi:MAG: hypothetical protein Q4B62_08695 [Clostridiaceae bacterium]|nr:hypothetical protein [Clostridiaceae bacterium]